MVIIGFSIKKQVLHFILQYPLINSLCFADVMSFGFQCFFSYLFYPVHLFRLAFSQCVASVNGGFFATGLMLPLVLSMQNML